MADSGSPSRGPKRWGLRTLGFLTIALASILAGTFYNEGSSAVVVVTSVGILVGFVGATWATVRGIQSASWLSREGPG